METETKTLKLAIKQNVHPNTDGSPWGSIIIDGTRLRVATWSGYEEKKRCEEMVRACNSHYELVEALKEIMRFKYEMQHVMSRSLVTPDNFIKALKNAETILEKANLLTK